jgi:hypothetical protein
MTNSTITKSKRQIVSSIEDGPTDYDREKYHSHLIEQYKLYVEMVDRLSARRVLVNNSFITLNGAGAIAFAAAPTSFGGGSAVFFQAAITLSVSCSRCSGARRSSIIAISPMQNSG